MIDPIRPWDFAKVTTRKGVKGSGLDAGEVVFISSTKIVPEKKSDPYLQRVYVLALRMDGDDVLIPGENNEHKAYLVDPRGLERLDQETQHAMREKLAEAYEAKQNESAG